MLQDYPLHECWRVLARNATPGQSVLVMNNEEVSADVFIAGDHATVLGKAIYAGAERLRVPEKRWSRGDTAGAMFGLYSLCVETDVNSSHVDIKSNFAKARIEDVTVAAANSHDYMWSDAIADDGPPNWGWDECARNILCPWLRVHWAAKTLQRAFKENVCRKRIQNRNQVTFKELMEVAWHPNRVKANLEIIEM